MSSDQRRLLGVTLFMPLAASATGVDGGAVFQILATENLGLGARAIGIAFGLGVVSVPVQLLAARMPLWRARRNLQLFLLAFAAQCAVIAALVGFGRAGAVALVITVLAEVAVSVLFAPAWQPLISFTLSSEERQRLNTRGHAVGRLVAAGALVVFGAAGARGRTLMLVVIAAVLVALAAAVQRLSSPPRPERVPNAKDAVAARPPLPPGMRPLFAVATVVQLAAWPVALVYAKDVLWPDANLGVLGAVQFVGGLLALLAWRATTADVRPRAVWGAACFVASAALLASVRVPVDTGLEEAAVVAAFFASAASITIMRGSMMELAHRAIDEHTAVRVMTVFDVVASSSLQVGLLIGGFIVSFSADHADWAVDPYRAYLLVGAVLALLAMASLRRREDLSL